MKNDTERIKNETLLLIAASKTTNFYKLEPSNCNAPLEQNITKSYKEAKANTTRAIHSEDKNIASKLGIDDRVERFLSFTMVKYSSKPHIYMYGSTCQSVTLLVVANFSQRSTDWDLKSE